MMLRRALQANALFSTMAALDLILFGRPIASLVGPVEARELALLAAQLAVFAAWLLWLASRPVIPHRQAQLVIAYRPTAVEFGAERAPQAAPVGDIEVAVVAEGVTDDAVRRGALK